MKISNTKILLLLIILGALMRLVPHPPNVTPLIAMGLLGGVCLSDRRLALVVVLGALLVSDLFLGFHGTMAFVYGAVALIVLLGGVFQRKAKGASLVALSLFSSCLFFVITNFGVWLQGALYARTVSGLATCYAAALPFFRNSLLGDLFYVLILFGAYRVLDVRLGATPKATLVLVVALICASCSGDSVTVKTSSNNTGPQGESGSSFTVVTTSADGAALLNPATVRRGDDFFEPSCDYRYVTAEPEVHTFCLEKATEESVEAVLSVGESTILVLTAPGCKATELLADDYELRVSPCGVEASRGVSVVRMPDSEDSSQFVTQISFRGN